MASFPSFAHRREALQYPASIQPTYPKPTDRPECPVWLRPAVPSGEHGPREDRAARPSNSKSRRFLNRTQSISRTVRKNLLAPAEIAFIAYSLSGNQKKDARCGRHGQQAEKQASHAYGGAGTQQCRHLGTLAKSLKTRATAPEANNPISIGFPFRRSHTERKVREQTARLTSRFAFDGRNYALDAEREMTGYSAI